MAAAPISKDNLQIDSPMHPHPMGQTASSPSGNQGDVEIAPQAAVKEEPAATAQGNMEVLPFGEEQPVSVFDVWCNKGSIANLIMFLIMVAGIIWVALSDDTVGKYVLSLGLFGWAGAVTNWLAVHMLFEKVPLIYGSGVIPARFKEIRASLKDTIMASFFDEAYMASYLGQRGGEMLRRYLPKLQVKLQEAADSGALDGAIVANVDAVIAKGDAMGSMLMMASMTLGGGVTGGAGLLPHLKPLLVQSGSEALGALAARLDVAEMVDVGALRGELDALMETKLEYLTAQRVKALLERIFREHLGWLIVWGAVFGGAIGIVCQAAGFGA